MSLVFELVGILAVLLLPFLVKIASALFEGEKAKYLIEKLEAKLGDKVPQKPHN
jgi:hypothetical protein